MTSDPYEEYFKDYSFQGYSPKQKREALQELQEQTIKKYEQAIHPAIMENYRKYQYFLSNFVPTAQMEGLRVFWETVEKAGNPVTREIQQVYRLKQLDTEYFFYHEALRSTNKVGAPIDAFHTVGKYPLEKFIPTINFETGEQNGFEIGSVETVYELQWKRDWNPEMQKNLILDASFVVISGARRYSGYDLDQFLEYSYEDLVTYGKFGTLSPKAIEEIKKISKKVK